MARGENSELVVSLKLEDNLSGPMKTAKESVDQTASATANFSDKIVAAGGEMRTFRRLGSELSVVGRALGGDFATATNAVGDFINAAGSAALATRGVIELGKAATTTSTAVTELAAAQNAAGAASVGFLTRFGPLAIVLTALAASLANLAGQHDREDFALNKSRDALVAYVNGGKAAAEASQDEADRIAHLHDEMAGLTTETVKLAAAFTLLATSVDSQDVVDTVAAAQQGVGAFADLAGNVEATGNAADIAAAKVQTLTELLLSVPTETIATIKVNIVGAGAEQTHPLEAGGGFAGGGNVPIPFTPLPILGSTVAQQRRDLIQAQADAKKALETNTDPTQVDRLTVAYRNSTEALNNFNAAVAKSAADKAAAAAAEAAAKLARIYHDNVTAEFDRAKKTADTLFDALHRRHLQAIDDAEQLAQTRHDDTAQAIADQLKLEEAQHAAPVLAAQQALNDRQAIQQRRDLVEAQQAAAQALAANSDPTRTEGLARALRGATEALQNFDASATIGRLQDIQQQQDAASEERARKAAGINDEQLRKARQAADIQRDRETIADKKRRDDFETQLAALQKRDEAAGKTPAQIQKDIDALSARFGITIDPVTGLHHITDPLVTAIKNVKIEPPKVVLNQQNTYKLVLGANELRLIGSAIQSSAQPNSNTSTRSNGR